MNRSGRRFRARKWLLMRPWVARSSGSSLLSKDVLLNVAEDRLGWVIVRTPFGHARPVQPQLPHRPPRHPRLDGMRRIAIQADPHHLPGIPPTHPPQEATDILRPLAGIEGPMDTALVDLVEQEQVEPPPGLLIPPQYQAFGPCVTSAAIRLDRDRLHIEEGQDGSAWAVVPPRAQPVQDQMPIGIGAEELATDAAKCVSPFFSTRRRCSRLIVGTMRWRMRYAANLANLQRPNGSPRVVALGRPGARWPRFAALTSAAGLRACAVGSAPTGRAARTRGDR